MEATLVPDTMESSYKFRTAYSWFVTWVILPNQNAHRELSLGAMMTLSLVTLSSTFYLLHAL